MAIPILPDETFECEGDDLHINVPVDIFTAVTGGESRIPTLDKPLILKTPPRTNTRRSFHLRGKGIRLKTDFRRSRRFGKINPPKKISENNAVCLVERIK